VGGHWRRWAVPYDAGLRAIAVNFLFVSAQLAPHLDWGGYLPTAVELIQRGHSVHWASGVEVAPLLRNAGVSFHALSQTGWRWPPPPALRSTDAASPDDFQRLRAERSLDQWLDEDRVVAASVELVALIRQIQPDVVVTEMFIAAAGLAAEMTGIPLVVAGWPAHQNQQTQTADALLIYARRRLDRLIERLDVSGINFTTNGPPALCSPHLHITYWSPSWFAGAALLPQTRHVGGVAPAVLSPDPALPDPEERPWVVVTLGTSFNEDAAFFVMAAQAAARLGCAPIIVLGDDDERHIQKMESQLVGQLPASAQVCGRIVLAAVLPYTAAAVHHGGAGMTHALVTHAVPQVLSPHAADQQRQAFGVQRSGVGLVVEPRAVTVDSLERALAALLPDLSPFRTRAANLRAEFATLGGPAAAADLLLAGEW
jgi:UDP:flavonoid glycosyltransferase YjiC (YdhE family)